MTATPAHICSTGKCACPPALACERLHHKAKAAVNNFLFTAAAIHDCTDRCESLIAAKDWSIIEPSYFTWIDTVDEQIRSQAASRINRAIAQRNAGQVIC